ncbi:MAG: hypothetical protein K940chlam6_00410 [Chlamydiae bacterium]|nr:hypothetical protein [Chlamydiota bacterium]
MPVALPTVAFVDERILDANLPEDHKCGICLEDENTKKNPFIAHQKYTDERSGNVYDGALHPIHKDCIKRCLESNKACPNCRIPIENTLVSSKEKIFHFSKKIAANADAGSKEVEGPMIFGAATIALIAAIELTGLKGAKDILAIGGCGYLIPALYFGMLHGSFGLSDFSPKRTLSIAAIGSAIGASIGSVLWHMDFTPKNDGIFKTASIFGLVGSVFGGSISPFVGFGSRAEAASNERISSTASISGITGIIAGTYFWLMGKTQDMALMQIFGIIAIAKSTGLIPIAWGTGVGLATAGLLNTTKWFGKNAKEATAAIAASSTALAITGNSIISGIRNRDINPIFISGLSIRFGFKAAETIAKMASRSLGKTGTLMVIGAVAGITAAAGSTLLNRAYKKLTAATAA